MRKETTSYGALYYFEDGNVGIGVDDSGYIAEVVISNPVYHVHLKNHIQKAVKEHNKFIYGLEG